MEAVKHIGKHPLRRNRVGILTEVKTCRIPAFYFSDGEWKPTTAVVKLIRNR